MQYLSLQFSISTNHLLRFITALPFRLRLEGFRARSLRCVCQMRPSSSPSSPTSSSPDRGDSEKCLPDGIVRQSQTESSAPLDGIAPRAPQTHFCSERSSLVASHRWNLFTCFLGWICNHDWSERCWWRGGLVVSGSERSDCNWEMSPGAASDQNEMTRK